VALTDTEKIRRVAAAMLGRREAETLSRLVAGQGLPRQPRLLAPNAGLLRAAHLAR
jgi:hypothetical protein